MMILEKIGSAVITAINGNGFALIAPEKQKFLWKVKNLIVANVFNFHL